MFRSISLMPHAVCWKADPQLIWTMVITNAITFLSYLTICLTLLSLARRTRKIMQRDWAYFVVGFALFIVACGTTHLMEVITTWQPFFWIDATANIVTAVLSAYIAAMLIRRAHTIGFSINDYAERLANSENEKLHMQRSLLSARKLEDWSRMSTAVAHEINNPLEAIHNLLYLIQNTEGSPSEVAALAKTAADEADRVIDISRSTLAFFRQNAEPEPVDIATVAESVRFLLRSLCESKQITIEIEKKGNTVIEALAGEIRQVLLNIVRNACEATPHGGRSVRILVTGSSQGVEVSITDHGIGIDPEFLPTLFHFGSTTKGDQGNGIGLWSVKQIVTRHGGSVAVISQPSQGTTFTLSWPHRSGIRLVRSA
jgi:signal transduction histidine kinase